MVVVKPDKFDANILNKKKDVSYALNIDQNIIKSINAVKLFSANIDYRLRFDLHISKLCFKGAMQINT